MDYELRYPLTELTAGAMLRVRDGEGCAIVVFEGQVWITLQDDPRDIMLAAGESFSIDRPGLTLVQALRDSKLIVGQGDAATSAAPASADLHQWARTQRSLAIAAALSGGLAALQRLIDRVLARAFTRASALAPAHRLALGTTVR